jgi:hypothetical protein
MPASDLKITALTAIAANPVNPATFPIPMVDLLDNSMAASGTTKKVTVNQILGAGGTATLASATITGDLTVDTNVLKVDTTLNRVGIGTASPARPLDIVGSFQSSLGWVLTGTPAGLGAATRYIGGASTTDSWYYNGVTGGSHIWAFGESTAMTLNSTGLGLGVSPVTALSFPIGTTKVVAQSAVTAHLAGNAGTLKFGISDGGGDYAGLHVVNSHNGTYSSQDLLFFTGEGGVSTTTERMRITRSGQVGIGVTPSTAWNTGGNLQVGTLGALYHNNTLGATDLTYNSIRTGTDTYQYLNGSSLQASRFQQRDGSFRWFNAPAGTSPNAITFTQAMTLTASGDLLVGTTSAGGNRLNVQTSSGDCTVLIKSTAASTNAALTIDYVNTYGNINFSKSGTSKWSIGILNDSASTPTFKVFNDAAAGVYVTYGATSWTGTSDERLKDIIEPISNAVAKVGSLRSVIGKFKTDSEGTRRSFLIAQDVQSVLPEAVDASNPDRLGVAYTDVIPLLVAAIKELTARVQTLEAK